MVNIIHNIKKGNSEINAENYENDIVDIMLDERRKKWRSGRTYISAFTLITCMLLTACGKADDIVTDYGNQTENAYQTENANQTGNTDQSGSSDDSSTNAGQEATVGQVISAKGKTVREMVGGATLKFEDSMEAGGIPVNIRVKCDVPDVESLSVYQVNRVSGKHDEEEKIVKNIFGETYEKVDELPHMDGIFGYEYASDINSVYYYVREDRGYMRDDFHFKTDAMEWLDGDDLYVHIYKGKYNDIDYYLLYAYSELSMVKTIYLAPVSLGEYIGDDGYDALCVYNKFNSDSEPDNKLEFSEAELLDTCNSFIEEKLGINAYDGMVSVNAKHSDLYGEQTSTKNHLIFTTADDIKGTYDDNTVIDDDGMETIKIADNDVAYMLSSKGIVDGYELYFSDYMSGVEQKRTHISDDKNCNSGKILVTSKGTMEVMLNIGVEVNDITENVMIIDSEKIKECFKAELSENIDKDKLGDLKQLVFDEMKMVYYPVENPNDENELTYIPAWCFTSKRDLSDGHWLYMDVYLNAIDGTFIDTVYNEAS
ncbi:MAG: hypothetical protein IJ661_06430 [Lachnospiraceae bacterium]|nr:hypothetical protein [Lachnospiraceae bacterium]